MGTGQWIDRSTDEPYISFRCDCGWNGRDVDVETWDVQHESDRAVRVCPNCDRPVPEWGALRSLEGASHVARGPLREALVDAGVLGE